MNNTEKWKIIEDFDGYAVSNLGRVLAFPRFFPQSGLPSKIPVSKAPRIIRPRIVGAGYLQVVLYRDKQRFAKYIHVLVAAAFCTRSELTTEVNHLDGDKTNNKANNLCWTTRAENMRHAEAIGSFDKHRERMRGNRHAKGISSPFGFKSRKELREEIRQRLSA